jgi:D-alanine-D-alanine ligase
MSASGAKKKVDADIDVMPSDGLLGMGRELSPNLTAAQESFIRESAVKLFDALGADGAPRIDFDGDKKTGEIWLNEVNPIPGSFAFYLWRAAPTPLTYTDIITNLIENAVQGVRAQNYDLNSSKSRVFGA